MASQEEKQSLTLRIQEVEVGPLSQNGRIRGDLPMGCIQASKKYPPETIHETDASKVETGNDSVIMAFLMVYGKEINLGVK